MPNLMQAYDASPDGRVELYLFWYKGGPEVDVAIYIHDVPSRKQARFIDLLTQGLPPQVDYAYIYEEANGFIPYPHTEYYEYTLPGPPEDVIARFTIGGSVSQANAVAL